MTVPTQQTAQTLACPPGTWAPSSADPAVVSHVLSPLLAFPSLTQGDLALLATQGEAV